MSLELAQMSADEAFEAIYETHYAYIRNSLRRLGIQERNLNDLVHDVFIVVHRIYDTCDTSRPLKPWLFAIAFRIARDWQRLGRNKREAVRDDVYAVKSSSAERKLDAAERRQMVVDALATLDLDLRAVCIMHFIDGIPSTEIAETLKIPVGTVYSRVRRAKLAFEKAVLRIQARQERENPE